MNWESMTSLKLQLKLGKASKIVKKHIWHFTILCRENLAFQYTTFLPLRRKVRSGKTEAATYLWTEQWRCSQDNKNGEKKKGGGKVTLKRIQ